MTKFEQRRDMTWRFKLLQSAGGYQPVKPSLKRDVADRTDRKTTGANPHVARSKPATRTGDGSAHLTKQPDQQRGVPALTGDRLRPGLPVQPFA